MLTIGEIERKRAAMDEIEKTEKVAEHQGDKTEDTMPPAATEDPDTKTASSDEPKGDEQPRAAE